MKTFKQIIVILIYSFFIFCGAIYLWPDFGTKVDETIGYNFSETLLYKIDLAAEKIKGAKSGFDSTIDSTAPNTANNLEERLNSLENANE